MIEPFAMKHVAVAVPPNDAGEFDAVMLSMTARQ